MYDKFVQVAYGEALKSNVHKKFGAVIVCNNKIISKGHNFYTSKNCGIFSTQAITSCVL